MKNTARGYSVTASSRSLDDCVPFGTESTRCDRWFRTKKLRRARQKSPKGRKMKPTHIKSVGKVSWKTILPPPPPFPSLPYIKRIEKLLYVLSFMWYIGGVTTIFVLLLHHRVHPHRHARHFGAIRSPLPSSEPLWHSWLL